METLRSIIKNGNLQLLEIILSNDLFEVGRVLNTTIEEKRFDMARVILQSGKVPQYHIQYCLIHNAIPSLDQEVFDLLTEFGADVNATGFSSSICSCLYCGYSQNNYHSMIKFAIDNGLDTNLRQNKISLLQSAIQMNKITTTQLLVDHPKTDIYECGNHCTDNYSFRIVKRERNYRSIQATDKLLPIDLRRLLFEMMNGRADNKPKRRL